MRGPRVWLCSNECWSRYVACGACAQFLYPWVSQDPRSGPWCPIFPSALPISPNIPLWLRPMLGCALGSRAFVPTWLCVWRMPSSLLTLAGTNWQYTAWSKVEVFSPAAIRTPSNGGSMRITLCRGRSTNARRSSRLPTCRELPMMGASSETPPMPSGSCGQPPSRGLHSPEHGFTLHVITCNAKIWHYARIQYVLVQYALQAYVTLHDKVIPCNTTQYKTDQCNATPSNTISWNGLRFKTLQHITIQHITLNYIA